MSGLDVRWLEKSDQAARDAERALEDAYDRDLSETGRLIRAQVATASALLAQLYHARAIDLAGVNVLGTPR